MSFILSTLAFLSVIVAVHFLLQRGKTVMFCAVASVLGFIINAPELVDSFRPYFRKDRAAGN